ncbi:GNAT family N-acetyltransferase [Ascidiimonas aurantiaca]|uniref:GNAT family N-acetyltransferase n=1 Tax=Ascidiimonas aurantiaca TaxID=1685432 RepID=UPI0030EDF21C
MKDSFVIREIQVSDNETVRHIIRKVLEDLGVPKTGSAYEDASLNDMTASYTGDRKIYYVVEENGIIKGGAGIAPLDNYEGNVCELQKMYFLEELRGKGAGRKLIIKCLEKAKEWGYEGCYLETMPFMNVAQNMYRSIGFSFLDKRMGDTGHSACPVWMYKDLTV